jgi:membrane protein
VEHFADYTGLYGSLSAIVIFMLWLYVCMYILLMGGEINLLTGRIRRL